MLKENFFYKFFKYKQNNSLAIMNYDSTKKFDLEDKIIEIDKKILETNKALLEAQIVKFRSTFSKSNNFIDKIGQSVYKTKLEDSINWYQKNLKELYLKRRLLQINLEKIKGVFWLNRIKRFFIILFIGLLTLLSLFILISGFMLIIYLLPIFILVLLGYLIVTKKY